MRRICWTDFTVYYPPPASCTWIEEISDAWRWQDLRSTAPVAWGQERIQGQALAGDSAVRVPDAMRHEMFDDFDGSPNAFPTSIIHFAGFQSDTVSPSCSASCLGRSWEVRWNIRIPWDHVSRIKAPFTKESMQRTGQLKAQHGKVVEQMMDFGVCNIWIPLELVGKPRYAIRAGLVDMDALHKPAAQSVVVPQLALPSGYGNQKLHCT